MGISARREPHRLYGGRISRLASRYRTKIYAGLGGAAFWLLAAWVAVVPPAFAILAGLAPILLAFAVPKYAALICKVEDGINQLTALVTPARAVRVLFQIPIVLGVLVAATPGPDGWWEAWGDVLALLGAANGLHAIAVQLAYHGCGDRIGNSVLSISASIWLVAVAGVHWVAWGVILALDAVFVLHIATGLLSDLRSRCFPKRGIGVFFGSFNPVHKMHLRLLEDLLERRSLEKIYVHATTVPKLHRVAVASGEIEVCQRAGVREYRKSRLADPGKNYFPTGNWFYEYDLRLELLKAAIADAGLDGKVEVLSLPDVYEASGFFGVLRQIKARHRGQPIHGLHGSDAGGMWVRHIFDDSGWIYPCPIVRSGAVSATAIRAGAVGLTSATVENFLAAKRGGDDFVFPSGYVFRNC